MTVLADTSIWIEFFRGLEPTAGELELLVAAGEVVCCGPVLAELVAGTPPEQRDEIILSLGALRFVDVDTRCWVRAGTLAHELRRRGGAVPLLDLAIAAAAVAERAELWTHDADFARVAEVEPRLRLRPASQE